MGKEKKKYTKEEARKIQNANLRPIKINSLPPEEQKRMRSNGGKMSVIARAQRKSMRAMLDYLLEKEIVNANGETATMLEAMCIAMAKKAIKGDVRAFECVRDTTGQKVAEKQEIELKAQVAPDVDKIKELNKKLN